MKSPRILVAPLEWGLGHATRCIPIIKELIAQDCEVILAASGGTLALLREEFPELAFLDLVAYNIRYGNSRRSLALKLAGQVPKILSVIRQEHRWLQEAIDEHKLDAVISDNRFGLYSTKIPCIYITHQLQIKTGNRATDALVRKLHYRYITRYSACWVPDYEKPPGIAGALSHPRIRPKNVVYIGCLSRFKRLQNPEKKYELLFSMSGPEPQRTIFEKKVLDQVRDFQGKVLLLRGLPGEKETLTDVPDNIEVRNHLNGSELSEAMQSAEWMISRSGYTTIMDILKIQRKTMLIPTPGQTEQEYLAKSLSAQRIFFTSKQDEFSLDSMLRFANAFPLATPYYDMDEYKKTVSDFVRGLKEKK